MRANILVIGDAMLDRYWYGEVSRISPEAPVPVVKIDREEFRLGAAANVAHNCATLGANVTLVCAAGSDLRKRCDKALIENYGSTEETTIKLRIIGRHQQIVRVDFEKPHRVINWTVDSKHNVVVISDYCKGVIANPGELISQGVRVLVDTKSPDYMRFQDCYIFKHNESEFNAMCRGFSPEEIRAQIRCEALIITRGAKGMSVYTKDDKFHFPAVAREVYDVTGAGDTVMAALAVMLSEGNSIEESARIANIAGGIVVGKFGTATVSRSEIDERQ